MAEVTNDAKIPDSGSFLAQITSSYYVIGKAKEDVIKLFSLEQDISKAKGENLSSGGSASVIKLQTDNKVTKTSVKSLRLRTISSHNTAGRRIYLPLEKSRKVTLGTDPDDKDTTTTDVDYAYLVFPRKVDLAYLSHWMSQRKALIDKLRTFKGEKAFKVVRGGWHPIVEVEQLSALNDEAKGDTSSNSARKEKTTTEVKTK